MIENERSGASSAPWRVILVIAAAGILVRALLMWAALPLDIQSDEANYLYLALAREHFGVLFDQHRYLWPPGYVWLVQQSIAAFGFEGLDVLRGVQVALSGVVGTTTMLFAWRLFSRRAAVIAGVIWAIDIPLASFSHFLWTETLFLALLLPALWHLVVGLDRQETESDRAGTVRLIVSGLLFGLALYVKEMPLYLVPALGLVVAWRSHDLGAPEAIRRATLLPLTAFVVMLPWTLRNVEVYGRPVLSGATIGENAYIGLNVRHMNFDLVPLAKERAAANLKPMTAYTRDWFNAPPSTGDAKSVQGWNRAEKTIHVVDRQREQLARGIGFAAEHPSWAVRTRLQKLSDFVTPLSFFTRHHALGQYGDSSALSGFLRVPLVAWSLFLSVALMLLGSIGYFLTLRSGPGRTVITVVIGYVVATSLLVAMSRFRVPIEPFLIVMSAGLVGHGLQERSVPRFAGLGLTLVALALLWWVSLPATIEAARMAFGGGGA